MTEFLWIAAAIAALAAVAYAAANTLTKVRTSEALMEEAKPYDVLSDDYSKTLLILGDSTGVGVGASTPEESVAGRLAAYLQATYVENRAKSGASVEDLSTQIQNLKLSHYDFILIQIGGNDILAFHDAAADAERLAQAMKPLPDSGKTVVMAAGNVGGATLFPQIVRPFHYFRTLAFHREFEKAVSSVGATYVNLYVPLLKDQFLRHPDRLLSADGLHPSGEGYRLWFERLKSELG